MTKSTHHSTDMDIVERLEYASMSTPEIALLREAAQYIRHLREEMADNSIVLTTMSGEELAVIDGELAEWTRSESLKQFFEKLLKEMIEEHESQRRPD